MQRIFRLLTLVLALGSLCRAETGLVFDQRYLPGNSYHQTVTTEQNIDMDLGGRKVEQRMSMTMGIAAVVEDAGSLGKRVTMAYDRAAITQTVGGQKFSFDSKEPDASNAGPLAAFGAIVGKEFVVRFDNEEKVVEVENFEATMQKLGGGNPQTTAMYSQIFSKQTVKRMMEQAALRSPPGKPIRPGNAWPFETQLEMPGIGKLLVTGFYTYKGMVEREGKSVAEVEAKAEIQIQPATGEANQKTANLINQMGMKIEEGRMEGTMFYDPAIQFTREAKISQNIVLTATIPDGTGKSVRLPMKQTISVKLDSFEPVKKPGR